VQILLTIEEINSLHQYQVEHHCKNISHAITSILLSYSRLQIVISKLEAEAWKDREEKKKVGTDTKRTIAAGAKKNTDSKVISAKNTLGSQEPGDQQ